LEFCATKDGDKKTIEVKDQLFQSLLLWNFLQLKDRDVIAKAVAVPELQSLLLWNFCNICMYNQPNANYADVVFQSLFTWNFLQQQRSCCLYHLSALVSILITLEFFATKSNIEKTI